MEIEISEKPLENWNKLIASRAEGNFHQTTMWADYKNKVDNSKPVFISFTKNSKPEALLLAFKESKVGRKLRTGLLSQPLGFLFDKISLRHAWLFGPILLEDKLRDSFVEIIDLFKSNVGGKMFFTPSIYGELNIENISSDLSKKGAKLVPEATFFVDLTRPVDNLWANLKKSARKAIKRTEEQKVKVDILSSEEGLSEYYDLFIESRKRMGFGYPSFKCFKLIWGLHNSDALQVFAAYHKGQMIAAQSVVYFNGKIREVASAQSNESLENKIYGNDAIKWNVIRWGHEKSFRLYDLAGFSVNPSSSKEKGIYQFKSKWGGNERYFNSFVY